MDIRKEFLLALHDFAEGGDGASFEDALTEIKPSSEEMHWALGLYSPDQAIETPTAIPDFIIRLTELVDRYNLHHHKDELGVSPQWNEEYRGDQGVHVTGPKAPGMVNPRDHSEQHSKQKAAYTPNATHALYKKLHDNGWQGLTTLLRQVSTRNNATAIHFLSSLAEQRKLTSEIIHFQKSTRNFTMIGPTLSEAFLETWHPLQLLPMQPKERMISQFAHSKQLFDEIVNSLERREIPTNLAFVTRGPNERIIGAGGLPRKCLTPALQQVLLDFGIINNIPATVQKAGNILVSKVPKDPLELQYFADDIVDRLVAISQQAQPDPSSTSWAAGIRHSTENNLEL